MSTDERGDWERREISEELLEAIRLAELVVRRLVTETHAELYDHADELRHLLHEARKKAEFIKEKIELKESRG